MDRGAVTLLSMLAGAGGMQIIFYCIHRWQEPRPGAAERDRHIVEMERELGMDH